MLRILSNEYSCSKINDTCENMCFYRTGDNFNVYVYDIEHPFKVKIIFFVFRLKGQQKIKSVCHSIKWSEKMLIDVPKTDSSSKKVKRLKTAGLKTMHLPKKISRNELKQFHHNPKSDLKKKPKRFLHKNVKIERPFVCNVCVGGMWV